MGPCETVITGGIVVVGAYSLGHSPISHGQFGVKICGTLKRARRFVVVESVDLTKSLIKELLGLRVVSRYRVMQVAIATHQNRWLRLSVSRMILCGDHAAEKQTEHDHTQNAFVNVIALFPHNPFSPSGFGLA